MGPNQSNTIKSALTASVQTNQISINSPQLPVSSAASKSASAAELAAAKINKLQAKVWNPNSPESWEPDMRGYHAVKGSDYTLPSDVIEQNRLELQHHIFRARFEGDIVCPEAKELVQLDGSKILDVGCAKGFWLESVRKENPFSEYHGVDIAENLATELSGNEPINIKFGNVLDRLPYDDSFFDFVHQRLLVLGMPKDRFADAIRELIRVTKPGGWIELVEADMIMYNGGPYTQKFSMALLAAMQARGLDCYAATNLEWHVNGLAANIVHQEIKTIHWALNGEAPLEKLSARNARSGLLALEDWMHKSMGITREEYHELVEKILNEFIEHKTFYLARALYFQVQK